jgi:dynein assembly factor 2
VTGSAVGVDMEPFQISSEELQTFEKALKKKEFRDLLTEYVKEIQDPENKKRYEAEIIEMERKRGQEVKFVNPIPGFVLRVLLEPGRRKVFVNVCQSQVVAEATCKPSLKAGSKKSNGTQWNIPYSLSPGREDLDKSVPEVHADVGGNGTGCPADTRGGKDCLRQSKVPQDPI